MAVVNDTLYQRDDVLYDQGNSIRSPSVSQSSSSIRPTSGIRRFSISQAGNPIPIVPPRENSISSGSASAWMMPPVQCFPGYIRRGDEFNTMNGDDVTRVVELLKTHDKTKVDNSNSDLDSLLILIALFSAIVAAFTIESYKNLTQDPAVASATLLAQLVLHLNGTEALQATGYNFTPLPSGTAAVDILVNTFWFLSLVCSIITASVGIFAKQWLRNFLNITCSSPEEWIRVREVRHEALLRWKTFELAAFLPLLLQLALLLFLVGLVLFLQQINPVVGWIVTGGVIVWITALAFVVLVPMISSTCPYQIAFLRPIYERVRQLMAHARYGSTWRQRMDYSNPFYRFPGDENGVKREHKLDIEAIIGADVSLKDNIILEQSLFPCVRSFGVEGSLKFIYRIVSHRLDRPITNLNQLTFVDYGSIPSQVLDGLMGSLCQKIEDCFSTEDHMLTTPVPISTSKRYCAILEATSGFYRLVDYIRNAKRSRYLYSWGHAMSILNTGRLPTLYLDPLIQVDPHIRSEIGTIGVSRFLWLLVERTNHNAQKDKRIIVSDLGVRKLIEAGEREIDVNPQAVVSIACAIFQFLSHTDVSSDALRACSLQVKTFSRTVVQMGVLNELARCEPIIASMKELNARVPGLVDEGLATMLKDQVPVNTAMTEP
ncbi:hypothetical protein QCA50_011310 [Cerrena zonata]|uniref:DUF6535 domain-containing protein n=1 Tax=Cerrena zonata TaxID=2478898 RepID=A0AAW0FZ99_9APHY